MIYTMQHPNDANEKIILGLPQELLGILEYHRKYLIWTDRCGHFMLCKIVPAPSYIETNKEELITASVP